MRVTLGEPMSDAVAVLIVIGVLIVLSAGLYFHLKSK